MDQHRAKAAFEQAMEIVRSHAADFAGGFPAPASQQGRYPRIENNDWTAGFYTGILWLCWEYSGDPFFSDLAESQVASFRRRIEQRVMVDHHDMGFIYTPSCVAAWKLRGDEFARQTALLAADNLKARFRQKGQFIQAWGPLDAPDNYRLIIDCLLNLPLLYWASEQTGDDSYRQTALAHLHTTCQVIFRPDASTYHTYYFDPATGLPSHGATKQGYSDSSTWSRGQAWGVCGLALNYAYTQDPAIPLLWRRVTDYFLAHLPADKVPYWDFYFREGDEPRDSSAGAIAVCGIREALRQGMADACLASAADAILESLVCRYAARPDQDTNGLLLHSTYGRLLGEGVDECCLWGDYFYMEALMRTIRPDWTMYW